ncbi:Mitochondrial chaperone BCS1 [Hypsibius exemplaris]|uniref:Mitochondrial chaperone BCS1 n=1 Tax=Hypsibius exemplaris TaxID=2072580 RepID=A0A9X6RM24_HYPEX|nr:Mitochondrial chaperone BCS1 [Hypsibius exemplaris]
MLLAGAGLSQFIPGDFGGGIGLAGFLAVAFPYIQKFILHAFDFNLTEYCTQFFADNTFLGKLFEGNFAVGTGVGVVSIGAAFGFIQRMWTHFWQWYIRYFSMTVKIPISDESYQDVLNWVRERQVKNAKHSTLETGTKQCPISGKYESVHELIPEVSNFKFWFRGRQFEIDQRVADSTDCMLVSTTGHGSNAIFKDMLVEVKKYKEVKNEGKTVIYNGNSGYWHCGNGGGKRKRPLESVILEDGVAEFFLEDIQDFKDSAKWYTEFGIPYRRGYLLHGPPGTGKTSFISALAGHFDLNVCILNLGQKNLTDESLNQMFIDAPENSMILLEDVDAAFGNRADDKSKDGVEKLLAGASADDGPEARNTLSFSGLLNAIDGVASAEGRILFMTTNYVEKLDSALIRPGRVDAKQYIGNATESQVERMFRRFNAACSDKDAERFVRAIFDRPERPDVSLAQLQGLFLRFKRKPADIFSGLSTLYE